MYFKPLLAAISLFFLAACGRSQDTPELPDGRSEILRQDLSNSNVTCFSEDSLGFMWIGTSRGLNRYDGYEYTQYYHKEGDSGSIPSNTISCLFTDRDGRLWVGTSDGLCYLTEQGDFHTLDIPAEQRIVFQILQTPDGKILVNLMEHLCAYDPDENCLRMVIKNFDPSHSYTNDCFFDGKGRLWSVIAGEARCYDSSTLELLRTIPTGIRPHYTGTTANGHIWISEDGKILTLDMESGEVITIPEVVAGGPKAISMVFSLSDTEHLIAAGDEVIVFNSDTRGRLTPGDLDFPIPELPGRISRMYRDSAGNLWIGFINKGFLVCPRLSNQFGRYPQLVNAFRGKPVSAVRPDPEGNLWICTFERELFRYSLDNNRLDLISGQEIFREIRQNSSGCMVFPVREDKIWILDNGHLSLARVKGNHLEPVPLVGDNGIMKACIADGGDGTVWLGALSGWVSRFDSSGKCLENFRASDVHLSLVSALMPLDDGSLMVGMALTNPLVLSPDRSSRMVIPLWSNVETPDIVTAICRVGKEILIGTRESGLYRYDRRYNKVTRIEALDIENVAGIVSGGADAWISSSDGLFYYDGTSVRKFTADDGTGGNQFLEWSASWWENESLAVFGGIHGLTLAGSPEGEESFRHVPVVFENLYLQGRMSSLVRENAIRLRYDQNTFNVTFADLDFSRPSHPAFQYKMEGYNRDWVDVTEGHTAYFFNVPSGHHKLTVRTDDGEQRTLDVTIARAPWNSVWAWMLYIMLLGGAGYLVIHLLRLSREKEEEKRVNQVNMNFFTNISHEFRTPLTMIAAPLRQLSREEGMSSEQKQLVDVARWNSDRMLRLVNQLLDFGKLDSDALKLSVSQMDVAALLRQIAEASRVSIESKGISLRLQGLEEPYPVVADSDKVEKIVSNLMGNALRFTPQGGTITLSLDAEDGKMMIEVANSGSHIPEDKIKDIFKRYYQVENRNQIGGTGIGLYFTDRLSALHHGSVEVRNLSPDGVCFTVTLPGSDVYSPEEHATESLQATLSEALPGASGGEIPVSQDGRSLLVVDDDPDMLRYLKILLGKQYNMLSAMDADAALALTKEHHPELIVSDVAMPGKDGFWLCSSVKTDSEICHIPVILLTAKTLTESQIQGLESGADAYVTKPFEPDYLLALIGSTLANRDRLRGILSIPAAQRTEQEQSEEEKLLPMDRRFLDEVYALLEENLSDSDFNVNKLVDSLHISRSKLYYKMVGLTGDTPNEFFRKYRLNRSLELLRKGEYNISEVGYMIGYSSPTIFSRNFKAMFGKTPTEYIREGQ